MNVVLAEQLPAKCLGSFRQVMEISAGVTRTGGTGALGIERLGGIFVNAAPQLQKAARGKGSAALRELRRHDAIEHVHAVMDRLQDIERCAHSHEIARLVGWQKFRCVFAHFLALVLPLTHRKPADREAIERERA